MPPRSRKNKSLADNNVRDDNTPKVPNSMDLEFGAAIAVLKKTISEMRDENKKNVELLRVEINDRVSRLQIGSPPEEPQPSGLHAKTGNFQCHLPYGTPTQSGNVQPVFSSPQLNATMASYVAPADHQPVFSSPQLNATMASYVAPADHQPVFSSPQLNAPIASQQQPPPTTWSPPVFASTMAAPMTYSTWAPPSSNVSSTYVTTKPSFSFSMPPCTISAPTAESSTQPFQSSFNRSSSFPHPIEYGIKLYPLPTFDGKPEDWPLFLTSFNETTIEFGYNNKQNLMRLHRALHGEAKRVVCSMLIYPDDVPKAMEELTFNFGRPDVLVRSQIESIKEVNVISDERIDLVLPFSNKVRNMVSLFKSAGCHHHLSNTTLLDQLVCKLPLSKQYEWAKYAATVRPFPTVEAFSDWINDLARIVSIMTTTGDTMPRSGTCQTSSKCPPPSSQKPASRRVLHNSEATPGTTTQGCSLCRKSHFILDCDQFKALAVEDRWNQVKKLHLCFGCLKKGHSLTICRKKRMCGVDNCGRMHHPMLHQVQVTSKPEHVLNCRQGTENQLFKIVPITLSGPLGNFSGHAMLDEGSSISLVEEEVATVLGLNGPSMSLTLQWYGDKKRTEKSAKVSFAIKGNSANAPTFTLKNVHTVKDLNLPTQTFERESLNHTKSLPIANYYNAKPVILLGLDNAFLGVYRNVIEGEPHQPIAAETKLGWVVFGPVYQKEDSVATVLHINGNQPCKKINQLVEEYLSIEYFGVRSTKILLESKENRRAREILEETTKYKDGHYEVGLLWRKDDFQFPSSYKMGERRLKRVEAKMQGDTRFAEKYKQEMSEYIKKGYARLLSPEEAKINGPKTWYLPHFGVVNPNKPEKLRIVFDAAASESNISLNSALLKGPDHAQPLISILFKFRQGIVGVAGDIREMFSQIQIQPADQDSQRFLWRDGDPDKSFKIYAMQSMIFGAVCSPCCAEYIKNLNANVHKSMMPKGCKAVIENTYVDDLVVSFNNETEAKEIIAEAININNRAGFELRSFVSNSKELQKNLGGLELENNKAVSLERQKTVDKILGLFWNTDTDTLEFHFEFHKVPEEVIQAKRPPTKREMLGIIMAIFDPFGLLANFTIASKILLQAVWKLKVDWDEELPHQLFVPWSKWLNELRQIQRFNIPRCYSRLLQTADNIQLHIFVDASSSAYAAVAYLRVKQQSNIDVALVAAKSRCAPVKTMTTPRLELQAAVMGCRLKELIQQSLEVTIDEVVYWSDSKTAVLWIRSNTREYKQFVACRIAEILSSSEPAQWRWLPGTMNVADDATRIKDFNDNSRWVNGPDFLRQSANMWPKEPSDMISEDCRDEEIPLRIFLMSEDGNPVIEFCKFSSYLKLLRVTAWILRFVKNIRQRDSYQRHKDEITAAELAEAETVVCRLVQHEAFAAEIVSLRSKRYVPKSSDLYQLTPDLGSDDVIRVGGRVDAAYCLPVSSRQPIIMPRKHHVTRLIMEDIHKKRHHQNDRLVINEMRQKFWVSSAIALMKSIRRSCPVCLTESAKPRVPLMGQLPPERLTPYVRPFSYTGVDYCGPFFVTIGRRKEKRWISLFTCLTTRAIHLEIACDLSADAFLLCLRNFMNRRGTPIRIRSDNGTNFVRAQKELSTENRLLDISEIQRHMSRNNIDWVFNCPLYPNAGGCWERLIQCVKRLLSRVLRKKRQDWKHFEAF